MIKFVQSVFKNVIDVQTHELGKPLGTITMSQWVKEYRFYPYEGISCDTYILKLISDKLFELNNELFNEEMNKMDRDAS